MEVELHEGHPGQTASNELPLDDDNEEKEVKEQANV
jgi:hypothetical protein